MKQLPEAFQPKNIFRNVYFWLAVGGSIFLLYVAFIAFTFLPRTTSEVTNANAAGAENNAANKKNLSTESPKKRVSSKGSGKLSGARFELITNNSSGWVDSDDHKMTIVVKVSNLDPAAVGEIIRSGGIEIEIDGEKAAIINSEPFKKTGFLSRAKAALSAEKFDRFSGGDTQSVEIKVNLHLSEDSATDVISKRFAKQNKTEVEGVKIAWK